ncbi:unnamed protein product [Sympodiomycopsis kandeliae]
MQSIQNRLTFRLLLVTLLAVVLVIHHTPTALAAPASHSRRDTTATGNDGKAKKLIADPKKFLQAAAAKVTPGFAKFGHRARRDNTNFPVVATLSASQTAKQTSLTVDASAATAAGNVKAASQTTQAQVTATSKAATASATVASTSKRKTCKAKTSTSQTKTQQTASTQTRSQQSQTTGQPATSSQTKGQQSTTAVAKEESTSAPSKSTSTASKSTSTSTSSAPTATATDTYGTTEAMTDLKKIMSWAGASDAMTSDQKTETVAALLSAAERYYPDLSKKDTVRYLLSDINAESSFNATAWNGGRLDSGASLGLMQVSPSAGAQELPLWQGHARVSANTFSWTSTAGPGGILKDYTTGQQIVLSSLTSDDLLRPWINIHIGAWAQSNLGRTAGCDPWYWQEISQAAATARAAEATNDSSKSATSYTAMVNARQAETKSLVCASDTVSRSVLTGLGSWVAGATTNGDYSYTGKYDEVSKPYFANIVNGLKVLTGNSTLDQSWIEGLSLTAGVVDYRE